MLDKELAILERLYNTAEHRSKLDTLIAPRHKEEADALGTVLELVRSNTQSLHQCGMCRGFFFGSASKRYCSNKCRQMAYRKL